MKDQFHRVHDYLRISLTDSCNFRCSYCMPEENISCMPQKHLMQVEEIESIAKTFVKLGVNKIRLTGGEPLVRKGADQIIKTLAQLPVELSLTTNGVYVDKFIDTFKQAGIRSLNVSIDSLQPSRFFQLTKRAVLDKVWNNILLLQKEGFHVKLNVVAMKGINEDEILDFIQLTQKHPLHVRFIEFMPFSGNKWEYQKVIKAQEMLQLVKDSYDFIKLRDEKHATAKKYKLYNAPGTFAFITTMSAPFCVDCNRMRITADGKMKNCLFGKEETDLLGALRKGEKLEHLIQNSLNRKHAFMGGQFNKELKNTQATTIENRSMVKIGG
nr:GTP 3',8-cyclase MoaA [Xanthovirga aplysinae]